MLILSLTIGNAAFCTEKERHSKKLGWFSFLSFYQLYFPSHFNIQYCLVTNTNSLPVWKYVHLGRDKVFFMGRVTCLRPILMTFLIPCFFFPIESSAPCSQQKTPLVGAFLMTFLIPHAHPFLHPFSFSLSFFFSL